MDFILDLSVSLIILIIAAVLPFVWIYLSYRQIKDLVQFFKQYGITKKILKIFFILLTLAVLYANLSFSQFIIHGYYVELKHH